MSEYTDQICGIRLPDDEPKPQIPTRWSQIEILKSNK